MSNDAPKEQFLDCVNDKGFGFVVNIISRFDFKVVGFCTCLLKILQFLSSATGCLVFLTLFGEENLRIRAQILRLPMREEINVIL